MKGEEPAVKSSEAQKNEDASKDGDTKEENKRIEIPKELPKNTVAEKYKEEGNQAMKEQKYS